MREARVHVRSDSDAEQDHGVVFATLQSLFDIELSTATTEPPRKKQRLDPSAGESKHLRDVATFVTLANGRIHLDTVKTPQVESTSAAIVKIQVVLAHTKRRLRVRHERPGDRNEPLYLTLSRKDSKNAEGIELVLCSETDDGLPGHLEDLCKLSHNSPPAPSLMAVDIAFAIIHLVAQPGEAFFLEYEVKWMAGISALPFRSPWLHEIAHRYLDPASALTPRRKWSPQDFYQSVHCPDPNKEVPEAVQPEHLEAKLLGFQRRAVEWLLSREHVQLGPEGHIEPVDPLKHQKLHTSFTRQQDAFGNELLVSRLQEEVRIGSNIAGIAIDPVDALHGGILAEEMGLGKTVEALALISVNKRSEQGSEKVVDPYTGNRVRPSGATLIITPPHILDQWRLELAQHSPNLNVFHYRGLLKSELDERSLRDQLLKQDVVLTTYSVLSKEVHYANEIPKRNLRHGKAYKPRRSPLVQIFWWRVCLDEAQMIESGVSNAAKVARLIPRKHAWAVTGTPLKKDVKDLLGLLIFLRLEPFCGTDVWNRLVGGSFSDVFASLFGRIAIRHSKNQLRQELVLPPQKRVTITIPFTATEEQNYLDLFRQMCHDVGVDASGAPLTDDWNPDDPATVERMRQWLTRLRQTCLHAEVGGVNRRALGNKMGPLRTVDEVLGVMLDQNETLMRSHERSMLSHKLTRGHLLSFGGQSEAALVFYLEALTESTRAVEECREQFLEAKQKAKRDKAASGGTAEKLDVSEIEEEAGGEGEEDDVENRRSQLGVCKQRLRSMLEVQHVCSFFSGTAYFQIKDNKELTTPESERFKELEAEESACYEKAKAIRKELLLPTTRKTTQLMDKVVAAKSKKSFLLSSVKSFDPYCGLESRDTSRTTQDLVKMLNEYSTHLNGWRSRFAELLTKKLVDQEEDLEITGEEYETSTKEQDEQYVLREILRAAVADRHCIITGQANYLINGEMKRALKQATEGIGIEQDKGPAPDLFQTMLKIRITLNPPENIYVPPGFNMPTDPPVSFRGILTDLRSLVTSVQWSNTDRSRVEAHIIEQDIAAIQEIQKQLLKENAHLEEELALFGATNDQRLEFYRQLQQISDAVAPLQEEMSESVDMARLDAEARAEERAAEQLGTYRTKRRFLLHLRDESSNKTQQRICVICQGEFQTGVLTVCGHQYCKECLLLWYSQHRSCPMCKRKLRNTDFHQVTYKPQELRAHTEEGGEVTPEEPSDSVVSPSKKAIYAALNSKTLDDIQNLNLPGNSYGVKIDTICRHLLWLREHDPGSKSIIFSQYREFLDVLSRAFESHKIGYSGIGSSQGIQRFREDPGVETFLLHAKANSSGLNLVNATHVFLCEPLINTAIELQAIARVHRIGQQRPTTVWMYLISGSVEEAVYDISVTRRLAHMQRFSTASLSTSRAVTPDNAKIEEERLDAANSMELQSAAIGQLLTSGQSGGEVVSKDDLWSCLFSKQTSEGKIFPATNGDDKDGAASREVGRFLRAEAADTRAA